MFYYVAISHLIYQYSWLVTVLVVLMALCFATLAGKHLAREIIYDVIEIYQRWQTAKADTIRRQLDDQFEDLSRRAKLEAWQRQARQQFAQRRTALQLGSAAMWKAGVFDIEIEEKQAK